MDIEKLITKPLEKEINTITGVDEINSTSVPNFSTIQVKFNYNVTPTEALRKVKDAVDKAKSDPNFPKDLPAEPSIFEMNFSEMIPVMNINLSGDYSIDQLHHYGKILEDRIEGLPEINKVDIRGVPEKEVKVSIDLNKMEALQINFGDVAMALQTENLTMSGGEVLTDGMRRAVRVVGEFADMEMIRDIVVKNEFQKEVRLRDIASVEFAFKEADSYAREYGNPVVMLDVIKRAGENLIIASDKMPSSGIWKAIDCSTSLVNRRSPMARPNTQTTAISKLTSRILVPKPPADRSTCPIVRFASHASAVAAKNAGAPPGLCEGLDTLYNETPYFSRGW